ncbi:hypothetical protein [Sulfitobacter sp. JB4-11]|uniref:hypothetical protein n=1 Tax=Sulfitobacter rhodophyticola TaxID=3238304 RepID=UPI003D8198DC
MKPNFALSLSFEGIRLLHRAAGGWREVGEVALDAPDMADALAVLRKTATALEPGGLRSKLLLPNDQIKYLLIDTPGMDVDARRDAAAKALDGATPYAVEDLAFDISQDGDRTHIAAVARETLAEAEAFAVEHRFHPVSFAAVPGTHPYLGEPFFGQAEAAAELLEEGETIEPDGIAVVVIGDVSAPEEPAAPEPSQDDLAAEEVPADQADPPDTSAPPQAESEGKSAPIVAEAKPEPEPAPEATESKPEKSPAPVAFSPPPVPEPAESKAAPSDLRDDAAELSPADMKPDAEADVEKRAEPVAPEAPRDADDAPPPAAAMPPLVAKALGKAPTLPDAVSAVTSDAKTSGTNDPVAPPVDPPAAPVAARAAGFASRRSGAGPDGTATSDTLRASRDLPANVAAAELPIDPDSSSLTVDPLPDDVPPAPRGGFLSRRRAAARNQATPSPAAAAAAPALAAQIDTPGSEEERMTIFGARKTEVGGKPRFLGLVLTAVLLVFLAGVAAWASVFLDDGLNLSRLFGNREPEITASAPQEAPVELPAPIIADTPVAEDIQTAALDPDLSATDEAVLDALRRPDPLPPRELTEEEVEAKYAATGIYPRAPVVPPEPAGLVNIDDLYLTSIDPISTANDAVALPPLAEVRPDKAPEDVPSPAAAGTVFTLDERGLVVPSPEGAMSPDGFLVYAGKPPLVPPEPPTRFQSVPQVTQPRPELAGFRPRPRPTNLVESNERAQLGGLSKSELAEYRPRLRPQSVQEQVAAASAAAVTAVDTEEAVAAALASTAVLEADPFADATRFAVQASIRPDTRPRNFARTVEQARRSAPEVTQVASAAAVAPRTVAPKIPSSASVSRSATVKNAINLRKVNLIGVYGKPSSRRALVRLGNGRYKKVVVGDRIDGGRVSAIGDSELRYTKGGRNVILKMPKS